MRNRRGTTLSEVLVVITLTAAAGALGGRLLLELQHVHSAQRQAVTADLARARLAREFRADVRLARKAGSDRPSLLRLTLEDGGRIDYAAEEGGRVFRRTADGEQTTFAVGGASQFAVSEDGRLATWIRRSTGDVAGTLPPLEMAVEAAVRRHRRSVATDARSREREP